MFSLVRAIITPQNNSTYYGSSVYIHIGIGHLHAARHKNVSILSNVNPLDRSVQNMRTSQVKINTSNDAACSTSLTVYSRCIRKHFFIQHEYSANCKREQISTGV